MANRPAAALVLREGDQDGLVALTRASSVRAGLAQRARIVLLASQGVSNTRIAELVGVSRPTVIGWRDRYAERGLAGLDDEARSGRPRTVDHRGIITATLTPPPKKYGVTHWSSRLLARHLRIGDATVARAWREFGVQPWRSESFRFSTDPELVAKVTDVVGLYLAPPDNAVVLCVDEKSQIQALDRTAPILPLQPGLAERRSHDYVRHGTTTLFAALNVLDGTVLGRCMQRHRHQEFIRFLGAIEAAVPAGKLVHVILDNYATHKHPKVRAWLDRHQRWTFHYTPTSGSWLNAVESFFSAMTRRRLRRGVFRSLVDLQAAIHRYVTEHNADPKPFIWTATPEKIMAKLEQVNASMH
jgi:transposase